MEHKSGNTVKGLAISGLLTALFIQAAPVDAAEVYRWVDENGEVHYSAALPPEYKDKMHDKLNEQGLVVDENLSLKPAPPPEETIPEEEQLKELPRDSSGLPRPKQLYSDAEMQRRMDNFLMLRYDSEQEITDAMNVEIKQLNYDRQLIEGTQASMLEAYRGQIQEAGDRQRAGLIVDDSVQSDINHLQTDIAENAEALAGLEEREESIREEFQKQLERYRFLVEQAEAEEMAARESSG
jgi:hypothetical protein